MTEAFLHANLATAAVYLGENQKALEHFRAAVAIARQSGRRRPEGWALTNLARLWHALGDQERALEQAQQALVVMDQSGDVKGTVAARQNLGVILIALGRHDEAIEVLRRGLAIATASGQRQAEATVRGRLGEALAGRGDLTAAIQAYGEALALYEEQRARRAQGLILAGLGATQLRAGNAEGRGALERARTLGRASGDPAIEVAALTGLAADALARGELRRARELSASALDIVESVRLQVLAPEFRSSYFASVQDDYEQRVAVLMASHRAEPEAGFAAEAFHASERARARSLLDGLAGGRADIRRGVASELLARETALRRAMERTSARFIRALAGGREGEVAALEEEIGAQLSQFQELQAEMRARSPRYAALTQPAPLTLRQVQEELLDDDTTLVELALGEERSHAFIVDRRTLRVAELPPRRVLDDLARQLYRSVSERPRRGAPVPPSGDAEAAALSRALVAPLGPLATRRIALVTQGALQYVPFAVLRDPDRDGPLLAHHELVTLPSASALSVLRRETAGRAPALRRVAVLADPVLDPDDARLPGRVRRDGRPEDLERSAHATRLSTLGRLPFTRREAQAIARAAGEGGVRIALGFDASRDLARLARARAVSGAALRHARPAQRRAPRALRPRAVALRSRRTSARRIPAAGRHLQSRDPRRARGAERLPYRARQERARRGPGRPRTRLHVRGRAARAGQRLDRGRRRHRRVDGGVLPYPLRRAPPGRRGPARRPALHASDNPAGAIRTTGPRSPCKASGVDPAALVAGRAGIDRLLRALDADTERAAVRYEEIRRSWPAFSNGAAALPPRSTWTRCSIAPRVGWTKAWRSSTSARTATGSPASSCARSPRAPSGSAARWGSWPSRLGAPRATTWR